MMKINIQEHDNEVVVALQGELDTVATSKMEAELRRVTDLSGRQLVIDCTGLEYISSSGLRFFMQLKRESEQRGGTIRLCHLNEDVDEIFHLSGFHHIFDIA